jgi:hypothetical protein
MAQNIYTSLQRQIVAQYNCRRIGVQNICSILHTETNWGPEYLRCSTGTNSDLQNLQYPTEKMKAQNTYGMLQKRIDTQNNFSILQGEKKQTILYLQYPAETNMGPEYLRYPTVQCSTETNRGQNLYGVLQRLVERRISRVLQKQIGVQYICRILQIQVGAESIYGIQQKEIRAQNITTMQRYYLDHPKKKSDTAKSFFAS